MGQQPTSCRSVFQASTVPLSERYTKIWVRLINQIERTNSIASGCGKD